MKMTNRLLKLHVSFALSFSMIIFSLVTVLREVMDSLRLDMYQISCVNLMKLVLTERSGKSCSVTSL